LIAVSSAQELNRELHWLCARRLSERRHQLGLTQLDVVARLLEHAVPVTNRAISAMENGQAVDVGRLPALARALECSVTYLLGLTDDPRQWQPDPSRWTTSRGAVERAAPA
jgi:transcriptional regulator with XRE-family HTH domain